MQWERWTAIKVSICHFMQAEDKRFPYTLLLGAQWFLENQRAFQG